MQTTFLGTYLMIELFYFEVNVCPLELLALDMIKAQNIPFKLLTFSNSKAPLLTDTVKYGSLTSFLLVSLAKFQEVPLSI